MILRKVTEYDFERIFEIMDYSFPNTEMRNKKNQKNLFKNIKYHVVMDEEKKGFIAYWDFKQFIFLEHFAVSTEARGEGHGEKMLEVFVESLTLPSILEVEPPEDEITKRRISFYERMGFRLNDFSYIQPCLRVDEPSIPLKIMSYKKTIDESKFKEYKAKIYKEVYNLEEELSNL